MIAKPIYTPKGRAGEYGDLAINIYTGCNHGCVYCYARRMKQRFGGDFDNPEVRPDIVESVKRQIDREKITGKLIHLCFSCDPYPADIDTMPTREIIKAIKTAGNHVQILTKGGCRAERDFDLLDSEDWFGVTITGGYRTQKFEPNAADLQSRRVSLITAHKLGIKTWVSNEPVIHEAPIYGEIMFSSFVDLFRIGKMNGYPLPEPIDWGRFGHHCERLCKEYGHNYYIKKDLRQEMDAEPNSTVSKIP